MKRAVRTRNASTWTESQYWGAVRSALRSKFRYWQPAVVALNKARRKYQGPSKLAKWQYQCAECKEWHLRKNVEIDHIKECGSLTSSTHLAGFLERLTPEDPAAYQVLCKGCHRKKTKEANMLRRKRHP